MLSNTKAQSSLEPKWALYSFLVCLLFVDQFTMGLFFLWFPTGMGDEGLSRCFLEDFPTGSGDGALSRTQHAEKLLLEAAMAL